MNAVDSEFRRNLSNEARRKIQIEKTELSRKTGPLNRFSTGNLQSLNVPDIRQQLLKYYDEHYSANLMSLCLVGNHSIDQLEELAVEHFTGIQNKNLTLKDFTKGEPLFDEKTLGHLVKIVPIKDVRQLTLSWPQLPDSRHFWDANPLSYISHVIGHEGKNSLLSELIRQDLADGLQSGNKMRCQDNFSGFDITVNLTEKGVANKNEVIRLIFAFINKMKQTESPPKYIHDEKSRMSDINFQFL